jgi:hypothetical protein
VRGASAARAGQPAPEAGRLKGTAELRRGRWYARVYLPSAAGETKRQRKALPLPEGISERRARELAHTIGERIASGEVVVEGPWQPADPGGETFAEWSERWVKHPAHSRCSPPSIMTINVM